MSSLLELRNLAVMVHGLHQNVEIEEARLSALMKSNDARLSLYHSRFADLLRQYSAFAGEYKHDVHTFYQSLLREVETKQQKEEEARVEKLVQEKLELMSNKSNKSNNCLEIIENVQDTEYSPATSMPNLNEVVCSELSVDSVLQQQLPPPQEMQSRDSVPATKPAPPNAASKRVNVPPSKSQKNGKKNQNQNQKNQKNKNNKNQNNNKKKQEPKKAKTAKVSVASQAPLQQTAAEKVASTSIEQANDVDRDVEKNVDEVEEQRYEYVYDEERAKRSWRFMGAAKSSTLVHISNIPSNVKVSAVQFFVMKRAKVTMRQIEETELKQTARGGQYALVRFRNDVAMQRVVAFINSINSENAQIAEQRKQSYGDVGSMMMNTNTSTKKNKSTTSKPIKTSWQSRVFVRLNDNRKWYSTEEEMYADPAARNKLFIRNFNILNEKCHEEMTHKLLEYGDIVKDIEMGTDSYADPYCVVTFRSLNDAICCRNSSIEFQGRWLEIEYLSARTMQRLFFDK